MRKLALIFTLGVVLLAVLSGCGGSSPSQAQVRACWQKEINAYATRYAQDWTRGFMQGLPSVSAANAPGLAQSAANVTALTLSLEARGAQKVTHPQLLAQFQRKCGALH